MPLQPLRNPQCTTFAPSPRPLSAPPETSRTLSTPLPRRQAAWRNPTRAPAILLPGLRTFATVVTWRLSSLTGVGDRRAIMDSVLCQTAYTVASCRAQARVHIPVPAPCACSRPRACRPSRACGRSEPTLRLSAQVDPDACYEGSECRDVLDGCCQVPDDSR
jgi:hypothetical protein